MSLRCKVSAVIKSVLWTIVVLLFPIASGVLSAVLALDTVQTLFLQGIFMCAAIIPPALIICSGKWHWSEIGFDKYDFEGCKKALFFVPLLAIFIPVAVRGFYIKSLGYVLGSLFLYFFVGVAEEIYFRGIIPKYLKKAFSLKGTIIASTIIFGIGHIASAFAGDSLFEIILTVVNALIFGWLAIEIAVLSRNITPAILVHFLFDFETKIVAMSGTELLIAEGVRGAVSFLLAFWLAFAIRKYNKKNA